MAASLHPLILHQPCLRIQPQTTARPHLMLSDARQSSEACRCWEEEVGGGEAVLDSRVQTVIRTQLDV